MLFRKRSFLYFLVYALSLINENQSYYLMDTNKLNALEENNKEQTLRATPTYLRNQSVQINKHMEAKTKHEDAIKTNKHDAAKTNNEDALESNGDHAIMKIIPVVQNRGDRYRIKQNLDNFAMIRKHNYVATPNYNFPVPDSDETLNYKKENYLLSLIPDDKALSVRNLDKKNLQLSYNYRKESLTNIGNLPVNNFDTHHNNIEELAGINKFLNDNNYKYNGKLIDYYTPGYDETSIINKVTNHASDNNKKTNQNYNYIATRNNEKRNSHYPTQKYDDTNIPRKEINRMKNIYSFKSNNNHYTNDYHRNEEKDTYEKTQILHMIHKQNKLIENIADRLLRDGIKRQGVINWTDFDDIVNSLESKHNRTSSTAKLTTTTKTLSTLLTLIDETEIRDALKNDPFVKRILKLANMKRIDNRVSFCQSTVSH